MLFLILSRFFNSYLLFKYYYTFEYQETKIAKWLKEICYSMIRIDKFMRENKFLHSNICDDFKVRCSNRKIFDGSISRSRR